MSNSFCQIFSFHPKLISVNFFVHFAIVFFPYSARGFLETNTFDIWKFKNFMNILMYLNIRIIFLKYVNPDYEI